MSWVQKTGSVNNAFLHFIPTDVYQRSIDSFDHELLVAKMKLTVCLTQYKSSSILNKTKNETM